MNGHDRMVVWVIAALLALIPLASEAQTTVKYVHTDALGSVVAMTDASGALLGSTREYEPYGAQLAPALQDGPGYTGHVQDAATGLVYMQQRYYDPGIGRFLSVDPVTANTTDGSNFNRYKYASNNPYRFTDPDGRMDKETRRELAADRRSIAGRCMGCAAQMATSARSGTGSGATTRASSAGKSASTSAPAQSGGKGQVTSAFTGDTKPTFTYAAAFGAGVKAELREGPNNDRYSITTPALGVTAAGTWNVVTASYDFLPSQKSSPADVGFNLGGEIGLIGVIGGGLRYTPPAKFEISVNAGLGAAARIEMFEVGLTPGKLP